MCFDITVSKYYMKLMSMINILVQSLERDQKYAAGLGAKQTFRTMSYEDIYTIKVFNRNNYYLLEP